MGEEINKDMKALLVTIDKFALRDRYRYSVGKCSKVVVCTTHDDPEDIQYVRVMKLGKQCAREKIESLTRNEHEQYIQKIAEIALGKKHEARRLLATANGTLGFGPRMPHDETALEIEDTTTYVQVGFPRIK